MSEVRTSQELLSHRSVPMVFGDKQLGGLLGHIPVDVPVSFSLTGPEGTGKTHTALRCVREFQRLGPGTWVTTEEYLESPVWPQRLRTMKVPPYNISWLATNDLADVTRELDSKLGTPLQNKWIVIDSVNEFFNDQLEEEYSAVNIVRTIKKYNIIAIFICQFDYKLKTTRGSTKLQHMVDLPLLTRGGEGEPKYVRKKKNRFGGTLLEIPVFS